MPKNTTLSQRNVAFLAQALELLDALPAELYAARPRHFERGGVGVHLRHVLDHYDALFDGLESGRIDYDARERDEATESELEIGRARLCTTIARLEGLASSCVPAREVEVATDLGGRTAVHSSCISTLGRELQYLVAHTVHHFALIAVVLRSSGHPLRPDFGVAPSTLRHEARSASSRGACAR